MEMLTAINVKCQDKPGVLRDVAAAVAHFEGNIKYTQQFIFSKGKHKGLAAIYMEIENLPSGRKLAEKLKAIIDVESVSFHQPFEKIWGSRIIIIGGGDRKSVV